MFILHRFNLNLLRLLWRLCLWLFFLICLIVLLLALMFPRLPTYKPEIEQWISHVLEQPVTIGKITTYWVDWMPTVALQQVRLLDARAEQSVIEIAYAEIVLNVFASLKQTQVITDSMILSGSQFALAPNRDGGMTLVGLPEKQSNDNASSNNANFLPWLLQQPHLSLHAKMLTWQEPEQPPLVFSNLKLLIEQQNNRHQITGRVDLPQQAIHGLQANAFWFESELNTQRLTANGQFAFEQIQFVSESPISSTGQAHLQREALFQSLTGEFHAHQQTDGVWQVELKQHLLNAAQPPWLPHEIKVRITPNQAEIQIAEKNSTHTSGGQIEVNGHIGVLSVDKLLDKLPSGLLDTVDPELSAFLMALQGTLHDIQWTYAPDDWRVRARFTDLTTKAIGQLPGIQGLSGQIDIQPDKGTLHFAQTAVTLNLPNLYNHPLSLAQLTGAINWQRTQQQWQLSTNKLQAIDKKTKLKIQVAGSIDIPVTGGMPDSNLVVTLRDGQLSQLPKYIPEQRLPHIARQLSELQLAGYLSNAQLLINGKGEQTQFELKGHFKHVQFKLAKQRTQTNNDKVAIHNLSGQIHIKPDKGTLRLEQAAVTLNLPNLYSHPLSLTQLKGDLSWQRTPQKWQVMIKKLQAFDNKMKVQVSGRVDIPQGGVPYSNLKVTLRNGQLSQIPSYFPDKKWQGLVRWFNEAQLRGRLNSAHALIQGPVNALFDSKQSRFEIKADINHVHLNYAQGWPDLSNLKAEVFVKGQSLTVTVQQGNILNSKLGYTVVEIADLSAPLLNLVGSTHGPAADGLRFIEESPLRDSIDLQRLELDGFIDLALNLAIPLANQQPTKVQGSILFKETTLLDKPLDITLTDVAGRLNFSENGVSTQHMRGKLHGNPVRFSVLTLGNKQPKGTMIQVTGFADPLFFSEQLTQLQARSQEKNAAGSNNRDAIFTKVLSTAFSGTTRWSVTVTIPNKVGGNNAIDIHFKADLLGMDIKLPAPLGKTAQEQRPFSLNVRLGGSDSVRAKRGKELGEDILVRARYGDALNGVFRVNQMGLERGSLVLGAIPAQLPKRASLNIKGHLPNLSITAWLDLFTEESTTDSRQSPISNNANYLKNYS